MSVRRVAFLCLAAAVIAGCGASTARRKSSDGTFTAVVPRGFVSGAGSPQSRSPNVLWVAIVPYVGNVSNFKADILVVHAPWTGPAHGRLTQAQITVAVRAEEAGVKRDNPYVYGFSPVRPLTVGGEPAGSVDFFVRKPGQPEVHVRSVFFVRGRWDYSIGYRAVRSADARYIVAVDELIKGWRWT
ncbi:MAG: hypothetical protein ACYDHH_19085 [Solirubrobacteraceae bacterium]